MKIYLASKSPRRKEILCTLGFEVICVPSNAAEDTDPSLSPDEMVKALAERKLLAAKDNIPKDALAIGSDTVVAIGKKILGKPKDEGDAAAMLRLLSGKTHSVYTGVAMTNGKKSVAGYSKTDVVFKDLTDREINAYVKSKEPLDKAGAYGIQGKGSMLVKSIVGDYFCVMGLPVSLVCEMYEKLEGKSLISELDTHL
ncbi:MAG: septum formation protein Maf [Clostridia bacterium]|nr:septum formation protein Maf [Clostridia bacterium]